MHKNEEINFLWFLGGHFNIWFVNDEIGKADDGGIMARSRGLIFVISEENMILFFHFVPYFVQFDPAVSQAACPNFSSAWMIFDDLAKKWVKADGDFKVECVDDPTPRYENL